MLSWILAWAQLSCTGEWGLQSTRKPDPRCPERRARPGPALPADAGDESFGHHLAGACMEHPGPPFVPHDGTVWLVMQSMLQKGGCRGPGKLGHCIPESRAQALARNTVFVSYSWVTTCPQLQASVQLPGSDHSSVFGWCRAWSCSSLTLCLA